MNCPAASGSSCSSRTTFIILGIVLLALPALASAELGYYCTDTNTSFYNWTVDGELHNITTPCALGCEGGECRSDASSGNYAMVFIVAYLAFAGLMAYLGMSIDKETHGHIQIVFFFLALYSGLSAIAGLEIFANIMHVPYVGSINTVVLTFFPWFTWLIMAYLILVFLGNLFQTLRDIVNKRQAKSRGGLSPLKR